MGSDLFINLAITQDFSMTSKNFDIERFKYAIFEDGCDYFGHGYVTSSLSCNIASELFMAKNYHSNVLKSNNPWVLRHEV